jgi:hypothetical protein
MAYTDDMLSQLDSVGSHGKQAEHALPLAVDGMPTWRLSRLAHYFRGNSCPTDCGNVTRPVGILSSFCQR